MSKSKDIKPQDIIDQMWKFHRDFMMDSMWMSYRYCIGRHTIASHARAREIAEYCYGHMSNERSVFTAYDINREIEDKMRFGAGGPNWHFPITSLNKIYTTAIDIFCEFLEDYNIKSKEDYLKYYSIDVILSDNERGYKIETTTWKEKLQSLIPIFKEVYDMDNVEDIISLIKVLRQKSTDDVDSRIRWIIRDYPNPEYFYFHDIEDLFIWNNLAHLFDLEHHYKVELIDGTIEEVFDTWTEKTEQRDDSYYYKTFGYRKITVPVNKFPDSVVTYIPKENIKRIIE